MNDLKSTPLVLSRKYISQEKQAGFHVKKVYSNWPRVAVFNKSVIVIKNFKDAGVQIMEFIQSSIAHVPSCDFGNYQ